MTKELENKYDNYITSSLRNNNFLAASDLSQLLIEKFTIQPANARKIIERSVSGKKISSSKPLTFGKGQFVYFLNGTILTLETINEIAKEYRPPLYRLISLIFMNEGIVSYYEALKIVASPLSPSSTKVDDLNTLVKILEERKLIYQKRDENEINYLIFSEKEEDEDRLMVNHYSKMVADSILISDIMTWFAKTNIVSRISMVYRNKNTPSIGAKHNNLLWDAFGYTKTTGINNINPTLADSIIKQTLVVFDIVVSREYSQLDLDGFYNRIQINLNSSKTKERKVLPIIVYYSCSDFVLNKIKKLGFLCYDIGSIYGSKIFFVIENIKKIQILKTNTSSNTFEKHVEETLKSIVDSGQEDQLKALKGTLFEVMMYPLLKQLYPNSEILPNVKYSKTTTHLDGKETKEGYEYDYVIKSSNPKEIIIVELKGYKSEYQIAWGDSSSKSTASWFFRKTFPFIRDKFQREIIENYLLKSVYITSGGFTTKAETNLKNLNSSTLKSKQMDVFYNREKILKLLTDNNFESIVKIIEKYYK